MNNIIGKNIKTLREEIGFNQANIAHFLNVDQNLISKVEKGERTLSSDMLEKLTCLFGVNITDIETKVLEPSGLSLTFRANDLSSEDLETISNINRITLNSEYMNTLFKKTARKKDPFLGLRIVHIQFLCKQYIFYT